MLSKLSKTNFWPVLIIVLALSTAILAGADWDGIVRQITVFVFLLVCPGMAIIRLIRLENPLAELIIAIALSLVLSTLLAELMVMTRFWLPSLGLVALILISLVGAILQIVYTPHSRLSRR